MFAALQSRSAALTAGAILTLFSLYLPAKSEAPQQSPIELVREAANNEAASSTGPGLHFMFRDTKKGPQLSQTKLIVETREATAGMLIAQNGQPLSPGEQQAEEARLENYLHQPAELTKKRKQEKEDSERTLRILKALPDAFLYESIGTVNASPGIGHMGHPLVRLKFRPNPAYQPPTHVEQVLTGMRGRLWIDKNTFQWSVLGAADEYRVSRERSKVMDILRQSGPMTPTALAPLIGKQAANTRQLLWRMERDGWLEALDGVYRLRVRDSF